MVKKAKKKKQKLTKEQMVENKKRNAFSKQIEEIFVFSGFKKIIVNGKQFQLGCRQNELDNCFIYENIIIICEDTIREIKNREKAEMKGEIYNRNHKLEKHETADIIKKNKSDFINILKGFDPDCNELYKYHSNDFKIYYLYFEYGKNSYDDDTINRYNNLIFIDTPTLNYFNAMAKSIKVSFKYELFRFLKLSKSDVGVPDSSSGTTTKTIESPIIYPDRVTGFSDGVRMVSFMMKPIDLIENCCVLRKDGWDKNTDLYQRLLTPKRIKSIRDYAVKNETTFLNNIIVALPNNVTFIKTSDRSRVNIDDINNFSNGGIAIEIPSDFNSMAIIDGQHRVYAYYEDNDKSNLTETKISSLRNVLHLLVTGIIYPDNEKYRDKLNRRIFESNLFVSINKNAKPVDADTLIQVQAIMNPTSGEALSRKVIELLNKEDPFKSMFQLSKVEDAPIKTASIIQYALSSLLVAKNNKNSLYYYWLKDNKKDDNYILDNSDDIRKYSNYAAKCLREYFKAIKSKFMNAWNKDSKLLKVISINAFIIALRETLELVGGPQNYDYYYNIIKKLSLDFNDVNFPYAGAQYSKFAKNEIIPLFQHNSSVSKR